MFTAKKICANCNEVEIRELLTKIIYQLSENGMCHITCHNVMSSVFTGYLWDVCECTHRFWKITDSVNEQSNDPGTNHGTHYPCIFRNFCVKEAIVDFNGDQWV